ncbi:glycosyltransferase family 4 protein [Candidatus Halobonum tyrrellensis]|uniref:Phosphatidylinositol glycantransferase-class A n=1 Tax=Candidatus Halobonum tyrrellensis G22 TaxID=1324957 RepID=V4HA28_9EURY|nr:glycosyltransferase family 4 protein [Candidatus Halobonum tyrrellensis]ESP86903.1 phosphatidylinositol glycantransferase-class A [Candidatus Halobonum tyrrellensis G22]
MHVAQLISTDFPPEEGIGYYTYNLAQQLLDRGHEVTVITRGSTRRERFTYDGIRVVKLPFLPVYPFHVDVHGWFVRRALSEMESQFDLVHLHSPLTPPIDTSLPVVATVHTSVVEDTRQMQDGTLRELYQKAVAWASSRRIIDSQCRTADRVTTVAYSVADELADYYGVDDALVLGNAVNLAEFDSLPTVDTDDPFVLYVGRLDNRKGVPDFLEAAERVSRTHDVGFKLVGQGPLEEKLRRKADDLGIADRTEFLGYTERDRLLQLFGEATVFVLPSHYEGLPTTLLEAMASGTPVVATAVSGVPDVVDDGENGLLVPPREPTRIADSVSRLLDDPELSERLSRAGRETIEREYTWESIGREFESLYATLVDGEQASER